ncbi:MAG: ATP-binding protein [Candidatus Krumholzibacteria bacterium]|nr:ATP-binding protein [Candidatus Krumholzibacteria bacterium]MDH4338362.1 ATP-binding protein [Candidatus Krumholzibacteria bacterium]MDH5269812.1 ATP-binding protein [Candidatus Krumholzibacteria bacterium]
MKSIRSRLVVMCLVVAALPAVPLALAVQSLLDKTFNVGLNETMEEALKSGVAMSRDAWDEQCARFAGDVRALLVDLGGALPDSGRVALAMKSRASLGSTLHGFVLARATGAAGDTLDTPLLSFSANETYQRLTGNRSFITKPSGTGGDLRLFESTDRSLLLATWTPPAGNERLLLFSQTDPSFLRRAEDLIAARQLFATLQLTRAGLTRSFFYSFVVIYGACVVLALALSLLIAERIATPIRRLSAGAGMVAAGDWGYRLDIRGGGETGHLVDAFNDMVARLDDQRRRLVDMEKMAAWREVARHLAHEIKNPLLPIRLTIEELRDQYRGDDPAFRALLAESTRVVGEEVEQLQRLVRQFSEFAKMPELEVRAGSLDALAHDVAALYPQVTTTHAAADPLDRFPFDPEAMRRVLINLYDNAVAMMPAGGTVVRTSVQCADGQAVMRVGDNGPGIPPEHRARIFEPYFTTRREGTGLGLAMVKNAVLLHGGDIAVESTVGAGTTFIIRLPLAGPPPAPAAHREA